MNISRIVNTVFRIWVFGFYLSHSLQSWASESNPTKPLIGDTSHYFLQLFIGLSCVILCIFALSWLLKRLHRLPGKSINELELLSSLAVGQRERIAIVRAGNTQLLLGIAPGNISTLHILDHSPAQDTESSIENKEDKTTSDKSNLNISTIEKLSSSSINLKKILPLKKIKSSRNRKKEFSTFMDSIKRDYKT